MRKRTILAAISAAGLTAALAAPMAQAGPPPTTVVYDSTVSPLPGNLPSYGFEADSVSEFGDGINLASTQRLLKTVTVTLSSWGCETGHWFNGNCMTTPGATFNEPITFNIYAPGAGSTPGALLATRTQTFAIPYRPASDNTHCSGGAWYDGTHCYNGLATNVTFDFSSQYTYLPNSVVYGIAYNTSHYGYAPYGEGTACYGAAGGCGYDSLNVALSPTVKVGSQVNPGTTYQNSSWTGAYCDNGTAGSGVFRLDSPTSNCWAGYIPAVQFAATPPQNATCNGVLAAGTYNDVTVPANTFCEIDSGVIINHDLNLQHGSSLWDNGATVGHDIKADHPAGFGVFAHPTIGNNISVNGVTGSTSDGFNFICSATVGANVNVSGSASTAGAWSIGGSDCGLGNLSIGNDLVVNNNLNAVDVSRNSVTHDMHVDGNTGGTTVSSNTVGHDATCNKDQPPATGGGNVSGHIDTCPHS